MGSRAVVNARRPAIGAPTGGQSSSVVVSDRPREDEAATSAFRSSDQNTVCRPMRAGSRMTSTPRCGRVLDRGLALGIECLDGIEHRVIADEVETDRGRDACPIDAGTGGHGVVLSLGSMTSAEPG